MTDTVVVAEIDERIEQLDLSMIRMKLQDTDEGPGWSVDYCSKVESEYKRFLMLKLLYPEKDIVPNRLVDAFWHQHILDTEKYASDCQTVFGEFMHHYPYFGMNGAEDARNLSIAFKETENLFEQHFGKIYGGDKARCRTQCKPQKCR